uniref:Uncharacterized protein n=1 Tax=Palpitomonas bilix TaxID=652834 RepID=A0A7S3DK92_9EUKA|mmetsp:Transcript_4162/g.8188  ORF Transcript_4162/g.8188 Transcript_4162/m.8188 type:complete len:204 (+) Transcript_4162:277-888(+)
MAEKKQIHKKFRFWLFILVLLQLTCSPLHLLLQGAVWETIAVAVIGAIGAVLIICPIRVLILAYGVISLGWGVYEAVRFTIDYIDNKNGVITEGGEGTTTSIFVILAVRGSTLAVDIIIGIVGVLYYVSQNPKRLRAKGREPDRSLFKSKKGGKKQEVDEQSMSSTPTASVKKGKGKGKGSGGEGEEGLAERPVNVMGAKDAI